MGKVLSTSPPEFVGIGFVGIVTSDCAFGLRFLLVRRLASQGPVCKFA